MHYIFFRFYKILLIQLAHENGSKCRPQANEATKTQQTLSKLWEYIRVWHLIDQITGLLVGSWLLCMQHFSMFGVFLVHAWSTRVGVGV
jgi:hypothetical protein